MDRPTISWRRLDVDGRETLTIRELPTGWQLLGVAAFREAHTSTSLAYAIECNRSWETLACEVVGFARDRAVATSVHRDERGSWTVDGLVAPTLAGCVDIDLGFSPATNTLPLRRLMLGRGQHASARAAWLRFPELSIEPLEQTYSRIDADRYQYESSDGAFRRELRVDNTGLIVEYPGQWIAIDHPED